MNSEIQAIINLNGLKMMKKVSETHSGLTWSRQLPTHAYHPNASLRMNQRTGYVARPRKAANGQ